MKRGRFLAVSTLCVAAALVPASALRAEDDGGAKDILYIGDEGDFTVKRFDAASGRFLDAKAGALVLPGSAGLDGPRGILIDTRGNRNNLILVNQNEDQNFPGEILRYRAADGQSLGAVVPCNPLAGRSCAAHVPFAPRGIVLGDGHRLLVADLGAGPTGRVAQFDDETGAFLGDLDFGKFTGDSFGEYHPRGLVFGPDGKLYVSAVGNQNGPDPHFDPLAGFILRFENGRFSDVFASNASCPALHRPEGLVFGPDGKLYVTSFLDKSNAADTDKIVIFEGDGTCSDHIDLDVAGGPRAFAQALLFGPGGRLFVPITNTGEVRRYDVRSKQFQSFVNAATGPLQQPWYLTFGNTDPRTLEYGH
ncbi:MAG TPA: hypothetical protein VNY05_08125 [Candidatus Acidoferrales bacterium]|nr:hypothetical protein [Candidatus Acidoferrales bacterium]